VQADASFDSMVPIEVETSAAEYLRVLEKENPAAPEEEKNNEKKRISNKTHRSSSDPDARLAKKPGRPMGLCHQVDYVMDNSSRVILDARAGFPGPGSEMEHALAGLARAMWRHRLPVATIGMDGNYRDADFLADVLSRGVTPHAPLCDMGNINAASRGVWSVDQFKYDAQNNCFTCPQGKTLKYRGPSGRQIGYRASAKDCSVCPDKSLCANDKSRVVSVHANNDVLQLVRKQMETQEHRISQKFRKRIESLFAEAKVQMGLRRMKFRGRQTIAEQALLTATAQNIKRLVRFLQRHAPKTPAAMRIRGQLSQNACFMPFFRLLGLMFAQLCFL
jgi:hypothetical protein